MDLLQEMNQVIAYIEENLTGRSDVSIPSLEVFPPGNASSADYAWEIWMPVLPRS